MAILSELEKQYSDEYKINSKISASQRAYDFLIFCFNFLTFRKSFKVISDLCKRYGVHHKKVLDIGSFTGYNSFYFRCLKNEVTGVELSNKIQYAQKRYVKYRITFIKGDINEYLTTGFINEFDFIFCSNLPIHYDTGKIKESNMARQFFQNLYGSMKSGAVFYYAFYSTSHKKVGFPVTPPEIKSLMNELKIPVHSLSENTLYDYPMVELIIVKE